MNLTKRSTRRRNDLVSAYSGEGFWTGSMNIEVEVNSPNYGCTTYNANWDFYCDWHQQRTDCEEGSTETGDYTIIRCSSDS